MPARCPQIQKASEPHVVETFDLIDVGTSMALAIEPGADYTAETVFTPVVETLREYGLPDVTGFDRDPRFFGSESLRDFKSPFVRFWHCLGVQVSICPPRRPDKHAFVERFHRSRRSRSVWTSTDPRI